MLCGKCGHELAPEAASCGNCGAGRTQGAQPEKKPVSPADRFAGSDAVGRVADFVPAHPVLSALIFLFGAPFCVGFVEGLLGIRTSLWVNLSILAAILGAGWWILRLRKEVLRGRAPQERDRSSAGAEQP